MIIAALWCPGRLFYVSLALGGFNCGYALKWPVACPTACSEYMEVGRGTRPYKLKSAMEIPLLASIDIHSTLSYDNL